MDRAGGSAGRGKHASASFVRDRRYARGLRHRQALVRQVRFAQARTRTTTSSSRGTSGWCFTRFNLQGAKNTGCAGSRKNPSPRCSSTATTENFDRLDEMPVEMWCGGRVHRINDSVLHLMRGEAFDIAGRKVFCMGGARSPRHRVPHRRRKLVAAGDARRRRPSARLGDA